MYRRLGWATVPYNLNQANLLNQIYLLAEILKAAPVSSHVLYSFIREYQVQVRWNDMALPPGICPPPHPTGSRLRVVRLNANASYKGARSTHAKEHTTTSPTPTLAQATAVRRYRTRTCTPDPILLENVLCRKLLHSVAFYNLAHRLTHMPLNTFQLAALRMPRRSTPANLRTRRKEGGRPKQKHSKGRKRRQHVARSIRLHEEGDNRSRRTPSRLPQDPAQNNGRKRKPRHKRRHRHCLRIL